MPDCLECDIRLRVDELRNEIAKSFEKNVWEPEPFELGKIYEFFDVKSTYLGGGKFQSEPLTVKQIVYKIGGVICDEE